MKCLLIATFTLLFIIGISGSPPMANTIDSISQKDRFRNKLLNELEYIKHHGITAYCPKPLSPEEIELGNHKLGELVECGNATINKFVDKLDDDVDFDRNEKIGHFIRNYAKPACEIFSDVFRCIGPVLDLCLDEREKILKDKIFAIEPLMTKSLCIRTGSLIGDILLHADGPKCLEQSLHAMAHVEFLDLLESDSTILFGDAKVCQKGQDVLKEIYEKVGECSAEVLELVKSMLGHICERTPCDRYVHDLQCY